MKQYDVKISHAALSDMEQIYSYIADRLLEPDTAMGQYNRIAGLLYLGHFSLCVHILLLNHSANIS